MLKIVLQMLKPLQATIRYGARVYWNIPKNEARVNLPPYTCRLDINICTVNNFYAFQMDPYGSASTKGTWGVDKNPSESFKKVMSRYMNDKLKIIGLQCRPIDMPPVTSVQSILPAVPSMPPLPQNSHPIPTNYQPLHVQTTAPNPAPPMPAPPVTANGIDWANGHSWQNADHNNNFLSPRAVPPHFHRAHSTSTSLRVEVPSSGKYERTHPFHRPPNPIMDPWRNNEPMTSLPPVLMHIPAICAPIGQNEPTSVATNTTVLITEESGETPSKNSVKKALRNKILGEEKNVLR